MYTRIRTLFFLIIICFATTSYVNAESWACSYSDNNFVIKRTGKKFKVMTAEVGPFEIISENSKNLLLLRNSNEQYLVMVINKQTKKMGWFTLDANDFLKQYSLGMGVTAQTTGKCENY